MRLTGKFMGLGLLLAGWLTGPAQTTLYWDTNGATAGLGNAAGSWNATHWSTSASGNVATGAWVNGSIARFDAFGAASVSLDADVTAAGIYTSPSAGLSLSGTGILTLTPGAVLHNASALDLGVTIAGNTTPGQTAFTLDSFYPVSLGGNNTYTGQTVINGGDIVIMNAQSLGANGAGNETIFTAGGGQYVQFYSDMTLNEGFTFTGYHYLDTPNNSVVTLTGPIVLQGGGVMGLWSGDHLTLSGVISESGGAGTFVAYATLSGANTFTAALQAGKVKVDTFNNAGVAGPLGAGTSLQLGYDYEGPAPGEIEYTGATATSDRGIVLYAEGTITVDNPATTLTLTGVIANEGGAFAVANPNLNKDGPGTLILRGDNTFTGETYLENGTLIVGHNHALGSAYVDVGYGNTNYSSDLSLLLENNITLPVPVDVGNLNNDGGSTTLGLSGSGNASFANQVYIERNVEVAAGAGGTLSFTSLFSDGNGGGWINKTGTGKAVFTGGIHLRGGGIDVAEGEVALSGSVILSEVIQVSSGAKLSGTALVSNATTGTTGLLIHTGATLAPGLVTGTMTTPMIFLENGSTLAWKLGSLTTANLTLFSNVAVDTGMVGGGSLAIDSTAIVAIDLSLLGLSQRPDYATLDPFWQTSQVWTLVDFSGPGANSLTPGALNPLLVTNGVWTGGTFDTFVGGGAGPFAGFGVGDVFLRFTPVPEPSTWALLGLGTAAALLPRLRRRR